MWQAVASIAALITAMAGGTAGIVSLVRSGREQGAKERADAAGVGLEYLERALAAQQETIVNLKGELGEVRGQLSHCETERHAQDVKIAKQAGMIAELQGRMP